MKVLICLGLAYSSWDMVCAGSLIVDAAGNDTVSGSRDYAVLTWVPIVCMISI